VVSGNDDVWIEPRGSEYSDRAIAHTENSPPGLNTGAQIHHSAATRAVASRCRPTSRSGRPGTFVL